MRILNTTLTSFVFIDITFGHTWIAVRCSIGPALRIIFFGTHTLCRWNWQNKTKNALKSTVRENVPFVRAYYTKCFIDSFTYMYVITSIVSTYKTLYEISKKTLKRIYSKKQKWGNYWKTFDETYNFQLQNVHHIFFSKHGSTSVTTSNVVSSFKGT